MQYFSIHGKYSCVCRIHVHVRKMHRQALPWYSKVLSPRVYNFRFLRFLANESFALLRFLQFLTDTLAVFTLFAVFAVFAFLKLFLSLAAKSQNHFSAISSHWFYFIAYLKTWKRSFRVSLVWCRLRTWERSARRSLPFACNTSWINTLFIHLIAILITWAMWNGESEFHGNKRHFLPEVYYTYLKNSLTELSHPVKS